MNDLSPPPKRVTRARATSRVDPGVKTAKIATAASKARAPRTVSTASRKAPANDDQDEISESTQDIIEPQAPRPRGRPRKVVAPPPDSDVDEIAVEQPRPRGRPRKTPVEAPAPQAPRPRGRPRKVDTTATATTAVVAPAKATRTRTTAVKAPAKKAVQFEEPGKENIVPAEKGKQSEGATGLRAKPLRKPAVPRATRSQPTTAGQKSPLSPKKSTQVASGKEEFSDDELLGTGKTPTKALAMSPVKPPTGVFTSDVSKKLDFSASHNMKQSVIASPARRPPSSPFKAPTNTSPKASRLGDSLLRSPVKLPLPPPKPADSNAALSSSLLRSPARRPQSPVKVAENGSPNKGRSKVPTDAATPSVSKFKLSKFATPRTLTKGVVRAEQIVGSKSAQPSVPKFSGRLSSIMPRDSDPALATTYDVEEPEVKDDMEIEPADDPMILDETVTMVEAPAQTGLVSSLASPPKTIPRAFNLREIDENPFQDSDSEDEAGSKSPKKATHMSSTPTPFTPLSKTPKTARSVKLSENKISLGFTPLAQQLSDWMPVSPERGAAGPESPAKSEAESAVSGNVDTAAQPSPARSSYFDEEMSIRNELNVIEDAELSPVEVDEEDFALAHEADEMSLLDPDQIEGIDIAMRGSTQNDLRVEDEFLNSEPENSNEINEQTGLERITSDNAHIDLTSAEETPSEASQEYGDENAIPIDPALLALDSQAPSTPKPCTPKRPFTERVFHTVSKVPLKAEAESSSSRPSPVKRSASVSKLPNQRPTSSLGRSNTVISYSPSKKNRSRSPRKPTATPDVCVTPSKDSPDAWSTIGTPARTPRPDLNTALLRGAVVFVDVHTTEGADASGLFVELLTQMGARCVKSWNWNGNKEDGSRIGITHVVFKDGGKRTLEKARESGGVVSCVGVGWILDCERENKWLDESAYAVDTRIVPRGGQRRRKSMEPRALENHNGTLVRSTSTTPTKDSFGSPESPMTSKSRRRDSVEWVRSPASPSGDGSKQDNDTYLLSPVPATPAPEAIASYGQDVFLGEETPSAKTPYYFNREQLVQKTAPQGKRYFDETPSGSPGFLNEPKDESVMMRLMAARRKSLQWAPKVGSPLAQDGGW